MLRPPESTTYQHAKMLILNYIVHIAECCKLCLLGKTLVIAVARGLVGKRLKENVVQKGDKRRKKEGKEGGKEKEGEKKRGGREGKREERKKGKRKE